MNNQTVRHVRPGGRSARVRQSVLDATLGELIDSGYAAVSVETIATRAGVNKTTIYRRWKTLEDLIVDALTAWSQDALPVPDTGDFEADLLAVGRELADLLNGGVGRQVAALVLSAGLHSEELGTATRRFFDHQVVRATPTVDRAIERGELPVDTDVNGLLTTFRAPLFYRTVTTGDPVDDDLIAQSVRVALTAARAGLLRV